MARLRFRQLWLWWAFVALLSVLCATLGVVQSRWLDEIGVAEQERAHAALDSQLMALSRDFDRRIGSACAGLIPSFAETDRLGSIEACSSTYRRWKASNGPVFQRVALIRFEKHQPKLYLLDREGATFSPAAWPAPWSGMRARFEARVRDAPVPLLGAAESTLLEFPLFGSGHGLCPGQEDLKPGHGPCKSLPPGTPEWSFPIPEEDWLVLELNTTFLSSAILHPLMAKHLGARGSPGFDAKVVPRSAAPALPFIAIGPSFEKPDATAGLLNLAGFHALYGSETPARGQEFLTFARAHAVPEQGRNQPRWNLMVHARGNSLEGALVAARCRNFGISAGILLLILATMVVLLRFSRRSEQLADLQMNFVAGVSHELRTPLTVIKTAAFNLRGKVAERPEQVERYGELIEKESEKLGALVDQVLRYGAARSGRAIGPRAPVAADTLIERALDSNPMLSAHPDIAVDKRVGAALPLILADEVALRHALQNLIENAVKYGLGSGNWIGVSAQAVSQGGAPAVEISVADRGPGIPAEEQPKLFDAFYRGKQAVRDQIHGTGLGLNIVKEIIEAHGGTIRLISAPLRGATFVIRIPAISE